MTQDHADLIARLRKLKWMMNCEVRGMIPDTTAYEAADALEAQAREIERLRALVDRPLT